LKRKHTIIITLQGFNFTVRELTLLPTRRFNPAKCCACWPGWSQHLSTRWLQARE